MTTRPNPPYRTSTTKSSGPSLQTTPTTLLSPSATLTGPHPISLGANVIIQIRARLYSTYGPLTLSENCIISERASVGFLSPPTSLPTSPPISTTTQPSGIDNNEPPSTTLAPGVLIESGAVTEAASIGAYTIIEAGARIGKGAKIGERCKICAGVVVGEGVVVGDGIVVSGEWVGGVQEGGEEDGVCRVKGEGGEGAGGMC
ncbi:hypothetical protein ABVK25_004279 [Lepraria finkii]|uniref:Dynactin subunit 6 n=1 Tax=Lepraria finkii TaxID=1340010 RepID=A0ABR4BF51_9LECA